MDDVSAKYIDYIYLFFYRTLKIDKKIFNDLLLKQINLQSNAKIISQT